MSEVKSLLTSPQLAFVESSGLAVVLTPKQTVSLYKKSKASGVPFDTLEEVYKRGYDEDLTETTAFDRVNSFIAGGLARNLDDDLLEDAKGYKNPTGGLTQKGRDHYNRETGGHLKAPVTKPPSELKAGSKAANRRKSFCARMSGMEGPMKKPNGEPTRKALALRKWNCSEEGQIDEKRGLWDNIHAKRERIKRGSGEHMRKPGSKGAPTEQNLKSAQEGYTGAEKVSSNFTDPSSRFDGTTSLTNIYKNMTPGQEATTIKRLNTIKKVVKESQLQR